MKAAEFIAEEMAQGIAKAIAPHISQSINNLAMKTLEEGLSNASDIIQTIANHEIMCRAPQDS